MSQTLQQLYHNVKDRLLPVTSSPAQASLEAVLLIEGTLEIEAAVLYSDGGRIISEPDCREVNRLVQERIERRLPVQYLLHRAWFYGLSFYVNPSVLIPRPETELLVEKALETVQPGNRILDVGTGPGSIAIALSHQLKDTAIIHAVDASVEALRVARLNQRILGTQVRFAEPGDLFGPIGKARFDLIVSNPPYVDPALRDTLMPEVLWHEPGMALFPPNEDAFHFYRRLAEEGPAHLLPGGTLMVEVGAGMGESVKQILKTARFKDISLFKDYAEVDRIVTARYPER